MIAQTVLRHVQQGLSKPPKRRGLSFETVDLGLDSSRQHIVGGFAAQLSELVFKMLLRLGGDMHDFLLTLEVGDELSGEGHQHNQGKRQYMPLAVSLSGESINGLVSPRSFGRARCKSE
jgi:hypothetical protein